MRTVAGFEAWPLSVNRDIRFEEPNEKKDAVEFAKREGITDMIVISHGWRNDIPDAQRLYTGVLQRIRDEMNRPAGEPGAVQVPPGRRYGVIEVYWPSKKSAEAENIPGGQASVGSAVDAMVDDFAELFGDEHRADIAALREAGRKMENDPAAGKQFLETLRKLTGTQTQGDVDAAGLFDSMKPAEFFAEIDRPSGRISDRAPDPDEGGAAAVDVDEVEEDQGSALFLRGLLKGITAKLKDTLDIATYYTMKERSGRVGGGPVNEALRELGQRVPGIRLHLIGHSFGGRLVTAAVMGDPATHVLEVASLHLLQAAYSHYGLAADHDVKVPGEQPGFFHPIVKLAQVKGPILVTHSRNDKAVGMAYAIASRLSGVTAAGIGDAKSPYGGMGRNGALRSNAEDLKLEIVSHAYPFTAGRIFNLNGDGKRGKPGVIGGHSDVEKPEIGHAILAGMTVL